MSISPTNMLSYINDLATEFGINAWQLQSGTFNGEYFYIGPDFLSNLSARFNPAAGMLTATIGVLGDGLALAGSTETAGSLAAGAAGALGFGSDSSEAIGGFFSKGQNNANLGWGNMVTSPKIVDSGEAKVKVFTPPNNSDQFEDMGVYGDTINVIAIVSGYAYQKANYNFFFKALNPKLAGVKEADLYVLNHPVLGMMENTRLVRWKRIHSSVMWRASTWELTFRTSKPFYMIKPAALSTLDLVIDLMSNILNLSSSILNTYGGIKTAIGLISGTAIGNLNTNLSSVVSASENADMTISVDDAVRYAVNNTVYATELIMANFNSSVASSPLFKTFTIDENYVYPQLKYFQTMSAVDVNNLANTVNISINIATALLGALTNNEANPIISIFNGMMADFNQYVQLSMNNYMGYTRKYTVPNDMNMLTLCFLNDLDFESQSKIIWNLNKNIMQSYNYIPKDLIIILPINQ